MARKLRRVFSFIKDVFVEFSEDRGPLFAAAISFYGLISLIPLLLLGIAAFGYVIGSEAARQQVVSFAKDFIPTGTEVLEQNLENLSKQSGLLGGLGLLGLLWTGSQVFVILQQVMNVALGAEKRVGFLRARAVALGTVVVVGALVGLSIGITSLLTAMRSFHVEPWGIRIDGLRFVWDFLGILLPVFISILAFTLVYKFLPRKNIGIAAPIIGGVTAGLLFEAAKHAFGWYVANIANFNRVYGSLGGVVILVLWIYYVSVITVLGAEVASVHSKQTEAVTSEGG